MIDITYLDKENLKFLGSGLFGTVYKINDDVAYKIYHKTIKQDYGYREKNPALKKNKSLLKVVTEKNKIIKNTDLYSDFLYSNGIISGVKLKYYDGDTLDHIKNIKLKDKIILGKKILKYTKELTDNNIYPTDIKLNNIMLVDKDIKIIDLDDPLTKINPFLKSLNKDKTIEKLDYLLKKFYQDHNLYQYYNDITCNLEVNNPFYYCKDYHELSKYIKSKEEKTNLVFININDELTEKNYKFIRNSNSKVILLCNEFYGLTKIKNQINKLKEHNIKVFNIINTDDYNEYLNNFNINEVYRLRKK